MVTAPVLLVGAARDRFALPAPASLSEHMAAAASVQTAVIPDGTITLMEQKPREVAAAVLPFRARHRDHMTERIQPGRITARPRSDPERSAASARMVSVRSNCSTGMRNRPAARSVARSPAIARDRFP